MLTDWESRNAFLVLNVNHNTYAEYHILYVQTRTSFG